jgi:transposase
MDKVENRYGMIAEPQRSDKRISDICNVFRVSRETWYEWKRRYETFDLDGLKDMSRKPNSIKNVKATK